MESKTHEKTYSISEFKGQLKVTIPIVMATALGIRKGDKVKWLMDRGELLLRKVQVS